MHSENKCEAAETARITAKKIIEDEWLDAGVTREELGQDEQLVQLLGRLMSKGRSSEDIMAEWEGKQPIDILREYAEPIPALRSA
jgi:hypothetical protein